MIKLAACLLNLKPLWYLIVVKLNTAYYRFIWILRGHSHSRIDWILIVVKIMPLFDGLEFFLNFFLYIYKLKPIAFPLIIDLGSIDYLMMFVVFGWFFDQSEVYLLRLWQLLNVKLLLQMFEFELSGSKFGVSPRIVNGWRVWSRKHIILRLLIPQSIWLWILMMICRLFVMMVRLIFVHFAHHVITLIEHLLLFPESLLRHLSLHLFFLHLWPHLYQVLLDEFIDSHVGHFLKQKIVGVRDDTSVWTALLPVTFSDCRLSVQGVPRALACSLCQVGLGKGAPAIAV